MAKLFNLRETHDPESDPYWQSLRNLAQRALPNKIVALGWWGGAAAIVIVNPDESINPADDWEDTFKTSDLCPLVVIQVFNRQVWIKFFHHRLLIDDPQDQVHYGHTKPLLFVLHKGEDKRLEELLRNNEALITDKIYTYNHKEWQEKGWDLPGLRT